VSLDASITIGPAVSGLTVIDDQVFAAMIRKLCKSVPAAVVHMYMDNQQLGQSVPDIYAQLIDYGFDDVPDGAMQGNDARPMRFTVMVASRGWENGLRTNDNRLGAAAAQIALVLEGKSVTHAGALPADGDHDLQVTRVGRGSISDGQTFTPASVVQITATGFISRTTGNSMLAMPAV